MYGSIDNERKLQAFIKMWSTNKVVQNVLRLCNQNENNNFFPFIQIKAVCYYKQTGMVGSSESQVLFGTRQLSLK